MMDNLARVKIVAHLAAQHQLHLHIGQKRVKGHGTVEYRHCTNSPFWVCLCCLHGGLI